MNVLVSKPVFRRIEAARLMGDRFSTLNEYRKSAEMLRILCENVTRFCDILDA